MNTVAAILYAVAVAVLLGTGLAMRGSGFTPDIAAMGLGGGLLVGVLAWWRGQGDLHKLERPRGWEWVPVVLYALFALRAFLWLVWREGDELRVLSPNNIGDMSLHLTFIEYFKNGAPFWPESPILAGGKLSYAAGMDIFNAMLGAIGVDTVHGLVCVGLVGAVLTGLALWRWGGAFTLMGFLCIGGLIGLAAFLQKGEPFFQDYAGNTKFDWAWKNPALAMLVTQRGFLFALPAGLLLLSSWRSRFFGGGDGWRLPFLGELLLYASMPIFHMHTFLALSFMLAAFFVCCAAARWRLVGLVAAALIPATVLVWFTTGMRQANPEKMWENMADIEKPQVRAQPEVLGWQPGWMASEPEDAEKAAEAWQTITRGLAPGSEHHGPFLTFWLGNFGLWPLVAGGLAWALLRLMARRPLPASWAWWGALALVLLAPFCRGWLVNVVVLGLATVAFLALLYLIARRWEGALWPAAFVFPALFLFFVCCHVKFAPWAWDNTKVMIWCVLIVMPFLWEMLIIRWTWELRTAACVMLFFTGVVSLLGGLDGRHHGYHVAQISHVEAVRAATREIPLSETMACAPSYNHPLLLNGRKVVLGYTGHVSSHGLDYKGHEGRLNALMSGADDWRIAAAMLGVRYLWWGPEEELQWPRSRQSWRGAVQVLHSSSAGELFDLELPRVPVEER
jgi:hypothetical protein